MTETQQKIKQRFLKALAGRGPGNLDEPDAKPAAVLMPLWQNGQEVQVVFTKRTAFLAKHAGQVSFPGGAWEDGDGSLEFTALRETCEEIGICGQAVETFARLDQVVTITNYLVTPFVGLVSPQVEFAPNPEEVERLVLVPLAKVLDRQNWRPTRVEYEGMVLNQTALTHDGDIIWGATARMIINLLDQMGPEAVKVASFQ